MAELADSERVDAAISAAACHRGLDEHAALKLVDRSLLVFDEGGDPLNVLEAVDALLDQKPHLEGSAAQVEERRRQQAQRAAVKDRFAGSYARMQERVRAHDARRRRTFRDTA